MNDKRFKPFETTILDYHKRAGRHDLPWRKTRDPYQILVSETMLQQTQVSRVLKKYPEFLGKFPTATALAKAPIANVLSAWQGLGYNRRALNLKRAAERIIRQFSGEFPKTAAELESLPGVGQSTRGAIMAFAFGIPTAFIETNIRAVYLHHFFKERTASDEKIHDRDILPLIEQTLGQPDIKNDPRTWYYALMDYGVYLKQTLPNPSRASKHHAKQSPFKGSNREKRSKLLKLVLNAGKKGVSEKTIQADKKNLEDLIKEGFLTRKLGRIAVRSSGIAN